MHKKKQPETIALDSEMSQRLRKSLETGLKNETEDLFKTLADKLVEQGFISASGNPSKKMKPAIEYLESILPLMSSRDFDVLRDDTDVFIKRYCFIPSSKNQSLVTYLQKQEVLDRDFNLESTLGWTGSSNEIFEEFWDATEFSPFELLDEFNFTEFWGTRDESLGYVPNSFE